ncbi:MAG TPA: radical SAM protein [Candidatus Margulisiibacteriota bacterium]|nr:radical SAM protein [Candidatus Margulisiibacteriota bacterium]
MARVAFVQNLAFEYLGVMYLSSLLKKNAHSVEAFIEHGQGMDKVLKELKSFDPQIIGFPCSSSSHQWVIAASRLCKKYLPQARIILGGAHPTFFPEVIEEEPVDIICRGEGEYALLELADKVDKKEDYSGVLNLWVKREGLILRNQVRPLIEDLDELPFPDRSLYAARYPFLNKSQKAFITGRGCPFSCAYCFNHAFKKIYQDKGRMVRFRSADNIIREIKDVASGGSLKTVLIQDDTFGLNKSKSLEFLKRYAKEINLRFICLLRADLTDEELVMNLKNAGCMNVFFGIESGSEPMRNLLLKKGISDEQIYRMASLLKKYRIRFRAYNMFGLPGESLEEAFKTVELNIKIKTDYPWSALFQPFPGTEMGDYARSRGMLEGDQSKFNPSFFMQSSVRLKDKREITNLRLLFFWAVKFPFLFPVIKRAIRLRLSFLYNILFLLGYAYCFKMSEGISLLETMRIGSNNIKNFIFYRGTN